MSSRCTAASTRCGRCATSSGLTSKSAMQDDVNGVSWLFADLLAELGIWFYTAAINPIRGARPKPFPGAFWWQGPSGKEVLAWNGYHYLFGRSQAGLGNWDLVDRLLPRWVDAARERSRLSLRLPLLRIDPSGARRQRPARSAHAGVRQALERGGPPVRVPSSSPSTDFGTAAPRASTATPSARSAATGPTTGPTVSGSSAYEIGVNRAAHEIVGVGESLEAWLRQPRRADLERRPRRRRPTKTHDPLRRAHLGRLFVGRGAATRCSPGPSGTARPAMPTPPRWKATTSSPSSRKALAAPLGTKGPEGIFNLGNLDPKEAFKPSGIDEVLVFNTLPWERRVIVEEPEPRGGAAPIGMLDYLLQPRQRLGRPAPVSRRSAASPAPSRRWATHSST